MLDIGMIIALQHGFSEMCPSLGWNRWSVFGENYRERAIASSIHYEALQRYHFGAWLKFSKWVHVAFQKIWLDFRIGAVLLSLIY